MADRVPMDPHNILQQLLDQMRGITERMNSQQVVLDRLQSIQAPAPATAIDPIGAAPEEDQEAEAPEEDESDLQSSDTEAQLKLYARFSTDSSRA